MRLNVTLIGDAVLRAAIAAMPNRVFEEVATEVWRQTLDLQKHRHLGGRVEAPGASGKRSDRRGVAAVRDGSRDVSRNHLDSALAKVFPSVSVADARSYNNLQRSLRTRRSHLPPAVPEPAAEPGTPAAAVP